MSNKINSKVTPQLRITSIGEVLWDVFPSGPRFGGAPANFACTTAGLGRTDVRVSMVSAVGNDPLGADAIAELQRHGVNTDHVARSHHPTGQVFVELDATGSASYRFADDPAWDQLTWTDHLEKLAMSTDAVCFGTLGQRGELSRSTIQEFVRQVPKSGLRILDVNRRPPYCDDGVLLESLEIANVLKLNDEELPLVAKACDLVGDDASLVEQLAKRFGLRAVALTRGPGGALLWDNHRVSSCEGIATQVVDTVGAGDAFTAAFALGLMKGIDLDRINQFACEIASFVCAHHGATPEIPAQFASTFLPPRHHA